MADLTPLDKIEKYATSKGCGSADPWVGLAGCSLDTHPTKHNWVEDAGGLPQYICEIARAILRSGTTKDVGQAISIAVSRCKVWAAGGGNVDAGTRAKAAKAVAEWEKKKAGTHVKASASDLDDDEVSLSAAEALEVDFIARELAEEYRSLKGGK